MGYGLNGSYYFNNAPIHLGVDNTGVYRTDFYNSDFTAWNGGLYVNPGRRTADTLLMTNMSNFLDESPRGNINLAFDAGQASIYNNLAFMHNLNSWYNGGLPLSGLDDSALMQRGIVPPYGINYWS